LAAANQPTTPLSLRIALVCPYSLSRPGGVQGQVIGLAREQARRGHRVTVFAPLDDEDDAPEGVDLVAIGHSVAVPANGSVAPVTLSAVRVVRSLRTLQSVGFDAVHVHEPFAPGLPYGLLLSSAVPPLVATFHRSGDSPLYRLLGPLARRMARRLAVRVAVSEAARASAVRALGGAYELGFNGVDTALFDGADPWPTERPAVLFLGRHEERKGLRVLLDAFDGLLRRGDRARPVLWIAGDGPLTAALRARHPESPDIRWLGVLTEGEKARRLTGSSVLCAPSLGGESFGMVLTEAMASRTVVVASDIDGYRQAAGGHAVLVPPDDPEALADAVSDVLGGRRALSPTGVVGDSGARDRWLDAAAAHADRWSMTGLAAWYDRLYRLAMVGDRG
jgi:phosphatidylinositol alpha-mannosyltransferase